MVFLKSVMLLLCSLNWRVFYVSTAAAVNRFVLDSAAFVEHGTDEKTTVLHPAHCSMHLWREMILARARNIHTRAAM